MVRILASAGDSVQGLRQSYGTRGMSGRWVGTGAARETHAISHSAISARFNTVASCAGLWKGSAA